MTLGDTRARVFQCSKGPRENRGAEGGGGEYLQCRGLHPAQALGAPRSFLCAWSPLW